jgi:hypothetical protein
MKNAIFWDVPSCGACNNLRFGVTSHSIIRETRIGELGTTLAVKSNRRTLRKNNILKCTIVFLRSLLRLLVTANVVPSSSVLVTLMMKAIS